MKNLQNTKTKLTIMFTLIISVLFLIIWTSFFVFKFYSDKTNIEQKYKNIEKIIFNKQKEIENFIKFSQKNISQNNLNNLDKEGKKAFEIIKNILTEAKKSIKTDIENILVEWESDFPFFNEKIIVFWNSSIILSSKKNKQVKKDFNILYSNIEDSDKIDFKKYLNLKNWIIFEKKLAVIKTNIWKKIALIFINRKYTSSDLFYDILYLILGIIFFSLIFYFIWNIFVKKVLKPVEENIDEMNNFIDNAGHELKTPLAAINSSAGLLKEMKTFDPELIQEVIDETNKSNEIIWALRSLSKISKNAETETFSIKSVIKEVIISQKEKIKAKKINFEFDTKNKDININANKNYFYILVSNIIWNAIKYNKQHWKITIKIENNSLIITDTW